MPTRGSAPDRGIKALHWLIVITAVLIVVGILNIYSSTSYMNIDSGESPYKHVLLHSAYLFMSMGVAVAAARCSVDTVRRGAPIWAGIVILLLLGVMAGGVTVNGARRWLQLGGLSMQPSELAKVAAVIWTAAYLSEKIKKGEKVTVFQRIFRPLLKWKSTKKQDSFLSVASYFSPLAIPLVMALFVLKQPDMGTAGLILLFPALLYILAGLPLWEMILGAASAVVGFFALALAEPYRWERVVVLWDPFSHSRDLGYQTVQSLIAVGSGGIWGQGVGEGMAKFLYLPEQYTDFAYAIWSQEFGLIGSLAVLALYVGFLFCGFVTASQTDSVYEALLLYGLTMLVSLQGILNIAMVIGCFPVTGVPLPFISYGGTSLLTNMLAVGLIWKTASQAWKRRQKKESIQVYQGKEHPSLACISGAVFRPPRE